jgi:hypothetical protein
MLQGTGPNVLGGSKFTMQFLKNDNPDANTTQYTFTSKLGKTKGSYPQYHVDWVARHLAGQLGDVTSIVGCTEYSKDGNIFRAHPAYRGGACWHDWAMIGWEDDDNGPFFAPGQ